LEIIFDGKIKSWKVFLGGFIMTLIKLVKSHQPGKKILANYKAQAVFEYLILTTVVAAVVLFFASTPYFTKIKTSCDNAFNRTVTEIVK